jgi:hypothetical protein
MAIHGIKMHPRRERWVEPRQHHQRGAPPMVNWRCKYFSWGSIILVAMGGGISVRNTIHFNGRRDHAQSRKPQLAETQKLVCSQC